MKRGRSRRGFTLLELLVTVTVVGLVLLVAVPTLPPIAGPASDVETARAVLRQAAATAARLDRPAVVTFDPVARTLELRMRDSILLRRTLTVLDDVTQTGAPDATGTEVRFLPDGRASGGPLVVDTPAGAATLRVDPWTGRVTVERG